MTTPPKGAQIIAEGHDYMVFSYDDKELGRYYILRGLDHTDYAFNREEWDKFAVLVAYADLKIRGRIE